MKFPFLVIALSITSSFVSDAYQNANLNGDRGGALYPKAIDFGAATVEWTTERANDAGSSKTYLPGQNRKPLYAVVLKHRQIYSLSCIPMSVEMVLKYNDRVKPDYSRLQQEWKDKADGNFGNFHGRVIAGLKFKRQFNLPRGKAFPLGDLFKAIDAEMAAGRKVIISLPSSFNMWHMYVIDRKIENGEYVAYSRAYNDETVLVRSNVKKSVRDCRGTDILTYKIEN